MPSAVVEEIPVTDTFAAASIASVPIAAVPTCDDGITLAFATTDTEPRALVAAIPVSVTGMGSLQGPSPQVPRPQTQLY